MAGLWFFPPVSSGEFPAIEPGLDSLTLILLTAFVTGGLFVRITFRRALLVVLLSVGAVFLRHELMLYSVSLLHPAADRALFQYVFLKMVYLWLLFIWIIAFPGCTVLPGGADASHTAMLKRVNFVLIVLTVIPLIYHSAGVAFHGSSDWHGILELADIQYLLFPLYLFFLFRLFLFTGSANELAR
ncbi:MAG: hypothetical protein ACRD35_04790 [Candidatus Acidiferrales bacterium]